MIGGRRPAVVAILALLTFVAAPARAASSAAGLARELEGRGIRDERVLEAFRRVPRDAFAPAGARARAWDDAPLEIGHGQTMSQPYVVALMAEQLGLKGDERVLEIGTGSGYSAAILASLAHDVYSVEIVPELAAGARLALTRAGFRNAHVKQGDGSLGWREYGPYDAVVVTAASPTVPRALIEQLRDGGVLVMPLGEPDGRQVLVRGVKRGTKLRTREVAEVRFVPLLRGDLGRGEAAGRPATRSGEERPPRAAERRQGDEERRPARGDDESARPRRGDDDEDLRAPRRDDQEPPRSRSDDEELRPQRRPDDRPPAFEHERERPERRAPRDDDELDDAPPRHDDVEEAPPRRRAPRDLNEEELPERDDAAPESDRRPLPDGRSRAARAPAAGGSDRRCEAGAPACAGAGSPAAARRSAG